MMKYMNLKKNGSFIIYNINVVKKETKGKKSIQVFSNLNINFYY